MKICTKCKIEKELTEFSKDKTKKDNLKSQCKICTKQWIEDNKEYFKQWREDNKEKIIKPIKEKIIKPIKEKIINKEQMKEEKFMKKKEEKMIIFLN